MEKNLRQLSDRYLVALRTHLAQDQPASLAPADELGREAVRMELEPLELTRIHESALVAVLPPEFPVLVGEATIQRAGDFFRQALTQLAPPAVPTPLGKQTKTAKTKLAAGRQPAALAAISKRLQRETARREALELALKQSRQHYVLLLKQSRLMQQQLRKLSHQILLAQEEERKHISRELHDEISQILTGINVRLAALKIEVANNTGNLTRKIDNAQRLVEKSVAAVHRFARELRPAMLDDLGLIPALLAFLKESRKRTGLQIKFTSALPARIEPLDNLKKTVLYRVTQEALTNVAKHAHAKQVKVTLTATAETIHLEIHDDGVSFDVTRPLDSKRSNGLGILGMRERVEMVGGTFAIESTPDQGTTIRVKVPFRHCAKAQAMPSPPNPETSTP